MELAPPRGMRDFYPEDFRAREALFAVWRESAALHGFQGYDAPVVETEELLKRKGGEEIGEQIYTFKDKGDRPLALRAEMTPSLARMVIARQGGLTFPLKWWAIAQCFRYERMTRGRKREHFQWNLDIIGEASIMAEAEVIGTAVTAMRRLGLTEQDFKIRIGSRALLGELFAKFGVAAEHFAPACLALDKRGKVDDDAIKALLTEEGLGAEVIARVFDLLAITTLDEAAAQAGGDSPAIAQVRELFRIAKINGFADFLTFDLGVVRGLGYYTGIVFEGFSTGTLQRAIFGGGRYDNLLTSLGGSPCPCVGMGFGDVVIQEILSDLGRTPGGAAGVACRIGYMTPECRTLAMQAAQALRGRGISVDLGLAPEKPKKFFGHAGKSGAIEAIFIGPDEAASGTLKIKNMKDGTERHETLESLRAG